MKTNKRPLRNGWKYPLLKEHLLSKNPATGKLLGLME